MADEHERGRAETERSPRVDSPSLTETQGGERGGDRSRKLSPGQSVGRYLVLRELGAGGMGSVYAAYDPELDRKVALKLVRFDVDARADVQRARLIREARAMAKLSHPNVVAVHDVGIHDEEVYVAMEHIDGTTLKAWQEERPRRWHELLALHLQAGRGLAAAHAQGLVHRDYKPENVLVSGDRVAVTDFGLARPHGGEEPLDDAGPHPSRSVIETTEITRVGAISGTPAYMSPEQFAGAEVGAKSDQFSFCVSLYEGLFAQRPFAGSSLPALAFAVTQGKVRAPPAHARVPGWLRKAVLHGLHADPRQRHPSMEALLEALSPTRHQRRRATWFLGATVTVLGGALATNLALRDAPAPPCTGAEGRLAGVWDDGRRTAADDHVRALALPWFGPTWTRTRAVLDEYAASWVRTHREACEATTVRGEQSPAMMDLRMACLETARTQFDAVAGQLLALDRDAAMRTDELLAGLPTLDRCSDALALRAQVEPPRGADTTARVMSLRERLAEAESTLATGRYESARARLDAVTTEVAEVDYLPLRAEHRLALARARRLMGEPEPALADFEAALAVALESGQLDLATATLSDLTLVLGDDLRRPAEAMIYARVGLGFAHRPGADPASARVAQTALGIAHQAGGRYDEALAAYRRGLDMTPADRELERADTLVRLARTLETQDHLVEAERAYREIEQVKSRLLGPEHPALAGVVTDLGNVLATLDRFDEAEAAHRRAVELCSATYEAGHPAIARARFNLGVTLAKAKRMPEAEHEFRAVLDMIGDDHPRAGLIHSNLAATAMEQQRWADVEREDRAALSLFEKTIGLDHPETIPAHSTLALAVAHLGRGDEAEGLHRHALALALAAHGEPHTLTALMLERLGNFLHETRRTEEAIELLERALVARLAGTSAGHTAGARFDLARALWDSRRDRPRALELARLAAPELESAEERARALAWLRERGG